jgi:S-adenosylmethionine synthetase
VWRGPFQVHIDTTAPARWTTRFWPDWIAQNIDLRPAAIIEALDLRKPVFSGTAAYGHLASPVLPGNALIRS